MKPWLKMNLRLGTLAIPVGIASVKQETGSSIRTLHGLAQDGVEGEVGMCGQRIELRAFCPLHDRQVTPEETVKAFEVAPGQYLELDQAELAALAPEDSREIRISTVAGVEHLAAPVIASSYWLTPSEAPVGRRPYLLLAQALAENNLAAFATATVKASEWKCAIAATPAGVLMLHRLVLQDERVDAKPLQQQLKGIELLEQEQHLTRELVMSMFRRQGPRPQDLASEHRDRVRASIDRKLAGGTIISPEPVGQQPPAQLPVGDLTETLKASLREVRRRPKKTQPRTRARTAAGA